MDGGDCQRTDEQIEELINRLQPYKGGIKRVIADDGAAAELQLVRHFGVSIAEDEGDEEDEPTSVTDDGMELTRLPGQHQLLGWQLDSVALGFLAEVGAEIVADEYG